MLSASYWPIILSVVATISPEIFERDKKFVRDKHTNLLIKQTSLMRSAFSGSTLRSKVVFTKLIKNFLRT